jgi:hypothetical protein
LSPRDVMLSNSVFLSSVRNNKSGTEARAL